MIPRVARSARAERPFLYLLRVRDAPGGILAGMYSLLLLIVVLAVAVLVLRLVGASDRLIAIIVVVLLLLAAVDYAR